MPRIAKESIMQARDIMTTNVISINSAASIWNAIALMLSKGISGLPVTEDGGRVCGVLTEGDLLTRKEISSRLSAQAGHAVTQEKDLERYIQRNGWCVADVMSRDVISALPETPVAELAATMSSRQIKRIPIIEHGRLAGIVSRRDILRAFSQSTQDAVAGGDDALRLAIVTRLRSDLGLENENIEVTVRNAQVSIKGTIQSELQRRAIKVLVEGVRGINGYVDGMTLLKKQA
jgi:CBS-domain-containing membrane protein